MIVLGLSLPKPVVPTCSSAALWEARVVEARFLLVGMLQHAHDARTHVPVRSQTGSNHFAEERRIKIVIYVY
jgi:hypothetical protein